MKLVGYLLKKMIPLFIGAVLFFALVLNLVDLFMNLTTYLQNGSSWHDIGVVMLNYIPKTIWYAVPVAILFSSSYTLSNMYANNELEALFASGVSLFKFTAPALILSIILSIALFAFENGVVVQTYEKKMKLQNHLLQKFESDNNNNVIVISENGKIIYNAARYYEETKRLQNLYVIFRDENKNLISVIHSDLAIWDFDAGHWRLQNTLEYKRDESGRFSTASFDSTLEEKLTESYEIFRKNIVDVQSVSAKEAKIYIEHLRKAGLPFGQQLSEYYKKFAFPFIVFIVVFLSIGLTGKTKKNVLLISLASCISASVLFYVMHMVTMVFAKHGYITPFAGAWSPVILFTIASIILLKYSRT
ncbi:LptF/LptG family permease [Treponema sp. C6A8]|uniref:LptF/LptG family permease n=1 Tax=Treponema sp. C6A8 TaxID=1410609 RepID=UPI000485A054|nr:LptF/LptG family permease [Treponema sp. C6A8]